MSKPKFSVVIPIYSELEPKQNQSHIHFRGKMVQRAIKSIINQQFTNWELILVDDGCADNITPQLLDKIATTDKRIKVIHKKNENRAVARNTGMEAATGEWLCWLDSDDEYSTHYMRALDKASKDFPEYNIFNFGSIIHFPDFKTEVRYPFKPEETEKGHVWFRSGHIGAGSFIFKRTVWKSKKSYRIPDEPNPYQFAADSKFDMKLEPNHPHVENPDKAFTDGVKRHGYSLGNPWGDDFLQFYRLTRDNKSKPLDLLLYIQYPRGNEEENFTEFGEIYDTI